MFESERPHQDRHALATDEFVGSADGVRWRSAIVPGNDLKLLSQNTSLRIDLIHRQLPSVSVRHAERRIPVVGVQITDFDRFLGQRYGGN